MMKRLVLCLTFLVSGNVLVNADGSRAMTPAEAAYIRGAQVGGGPGGGPGGTLVDSVCGILANCQLPFNAFGCEQQFGTCPDHVVVSGATDADRTCSENPNPFGCHCTQEVPSVVCATYYLCQTNSEGQCEQYGTGAQSHANENCEYECFP